MLFFIVKDIYDCHVENRGWGQEYERETINETTALT